MASNEKFSNGAAWIDGDIVPISEAKISILDNGFLHSDATYDVAHVWKGRFFRLSDHLERFFSGMSQLHLSIPFTPHQLESILIDCVRASGLKDAYVEMICTRGPAAPGSRDPRDCENKFYAFAIPFVWIADAEKREKGLNLMISDVQRISPLSVNPSVKNYHWLDLVMALYQAYEQGAETAVLVDGAGHVIEGPGFNIFIVKDQHVYTPDSGILEGITRKTVLQLSRKFGYTTRTTPISIDKVRQADEVFITSTAGGIIPVTRIDHRAVAQGRLGEVTLKLQNAYWALHDEERYSLDINYS